MRTLKQRLAHLAIALALATGFAIAAGRTLSAQGDDIGTTCVFYGETFGVCLQQTAWPDGSITTRTFWFWGNSWGPLF
jgi:hypothetical protein